MNRATHSGVAQMPDSEPPFKVDGDRPLRMRMATLGAIIGAVALAVWYAGTFKQDLASQGERGKTIEIRMSALEANARELSGILIEQRMALRLMDQKLDYIAGGRRGPVPASSTP